jgi:hypothetical protein
VDPKLGKPRRDERERERVGGLEEMSEIRRWLS